MGFWGNMVSAVKGAVAKVATVVTQLETTVSNKIAGLFEIGTSMINLVGDVTGVIADIANICDDGEINEDEKERLNKDINKVYVGASILFNELKDSDVGKLIDDPTSTFNQLNDNLRSSSFNRWLNDKENDNGLIKWVKDEVHDTLKKRIIRAEAMTSTVINTTKGAIEFVEKPFELETKEKWRYVNSLFGEDGFFRTGNPDKFIDANKQNLKEREQWVNQIKSIPGQIIDDAKTALTPNKIYDWCFNPDMSLEDATESNQSTVNTAMLVDGVNGLVKGKFNKVLKENMNL
ncbi:hypothetical protein [Clostridium weizhouense]|uniref:Pre-toxin TG domain-containing protein n=1 Tax=Clostridium weizhouense TaxID=2859781 RepID=A0ABS7ARL3_9CLOT|nr:hypothetical protein [Clostridium weizhouense]MBW6410698.1 hypothetical protein [Clostridium weizhouense]